LSDELGVPPYIVFGDVSLRHMARVYPRSEDDFRRIHGVGERKLREFGPAFLEAIVTYLGSHSAQTFSGDAGLGGSRSAGGGAGAAVSGTVTRSEPSRTGMNDRVRETLRMIREGRSVEETARIRGLEPRTVYDHLARAIESGETVDLDPFVGPTERNEIEEAFREHGTLSLKQVREALGEKYEYEILSLVRASIRGRPQ
jgi:ATP-dependent DNA helicase RecQ